MENEVKYMVNVLKDVANSIIEMLQRKIDKGETLSALEISQINSLRTIIQLIHNHTLKIRKE